MMRCPNPGRHRAASRVNWAAVNEARRLATFDVKVGKISPKLWASGVRFRPKVDKRTGKVSERIEGGVFIRYATTIMRQRKKDGRIVDEPRKQTALFTYTSKMICPSFSLPAGVPPIGTCPAAAEKTVTTQGDYLPFLQPGDAPLDRRPLDPDSLKKRERRPFDYVCGVCYAGKGNYDPRGRLGPTVSFAQAIRVAWIQSVFASNPRDPASAFGSAMSEAIRLFIEAEGFAEIVAMKKVNPTYFRVHDSGDLFVPALGSHPPIREQYFLGWLATAWALPQVRFWTPTRLWVYKWFRDMVNGVTTGGLMPRNFVLRPSALYINMRPPRNLGPGFAAGSMCAKGHLIDSGETPLPREVWDCPAYRGDTAQHNCESQVGIDGRQPCRVCWTHPEVEVNYREH